MARACANALLKQRAADAHAGAGADADADDGGEDIVLLYVQGA